MYTLQNVYSNTTEKKPPNQNIFTIFRNQNLEELFQM